MLIKAIQTLPAKHASVNAALFGAGDVAKKRFCSLELNARLARAHTRVISESQHAHARAGLSGHPAFPMTTHVISDMDPCHSVSPRSPAYTSAITVAHLIRNVSNLQCFVISCCNCIKNAVYIYRRACIFVS